MYNIDHIKNEIRQLYENGQIVHVSVSQTHPRVVVEEAPAKITGVYKNIFQVEECTESSRPAHHTFQYGEVLIGHVVIRELSYTPAVLKKK